MTRAVRRWRQRRTCAANSNVVLGRFRFATQLLRVVLVARLATTALLGLIQQQQQRPHTFRLFVQGLRVAPRYKRRRQSSSWDAFSSGTETNRPVVVVVDCSPEMSWTRATSHWVALLAAPATAVAVWVMALPPPGIADAMDWTEPPMAVAAVERILHSPTTMMTPTTTTTTTKNTIYEDQWRFDNGEVIFSSRVTRVGPLRLLHPVLLGSGGGGAVFAMEQQDQPESLSSRSKTTLSKELTSPVLSLSSTSSLPLVALKVSWERSTRSVRNECQILQTIQHQSKMLGLPPNDSLERCLGMAPYPLEQKTNTATGIGDGAVVGDDDDSEAKRSSRVMIALQPVFAADPWVGSLAELESQWQLETAIRAIVQTMVQLLSLGIVTVDVQSLISKSTGQVLFVDFTEARQLQRQQSDETADLALISNFVSEIMAWMPDDDDDNSARGQARPTLSSSSGGSGSTKKDQRNSIYMDLASRALLEYLPLYPPLYSRDCYDVLLAQSFSPEAIAMLQHDKQQQQHTLIKLR